jgi:hypothetical protein
MNVLFAHERGWIAYNKNLKNSIWLVIKCVVK